MLFLFINHNYYSLSAIIWKIFYKNDEIIPFIDSHSRILFYLPRKVAHKRPLYRHPTVHLLVINSKNELLLQKRSKSTRIFPLRWDSSVGGHVTKGESLESALKKEAYEEIALDNFKAEFLAQYEIIADNNLESVCLFIAKHDGPFQANPNEVSELKFWSLEEIENTHRSHFTDHLIEEEIRYLKSYLMKKKINRR
jgi:isopentenyldiphosphate isomerase